MKIVIFHFKLNNLLNWIKMTHFELNNILNWITKIIKNWIIFWIEFSWNDFESNIELNQFWAKFKHWIESIWVSDRANMHTKLHLMNSLYVSITHKGNYRFCRGLWIWSLLGLMWQHFRRSTSRYPGHPTLSFASRSS